MNKIKLNRLNIFILLLSMAIIYTFFALYAKKSEDCFSEKVVINNCHKNKDNFINLSNYIDRNILSSFEEIEFLENGDIGCFLHGDLLSDSPAYLVDLQFYSKSSYPIVIDLLPKKQIQISLADTVMIFNNWLWYFEGRKNTNGFEFCLKYLNLTDVQVDSLRSLVSKVNCKAIEVSQNRDILLRFCGVGMCEIQYIISKNSNYLDIGYAKIDSNIYFGLNKDSLLCGNCLLKE